MKAIKCPKGCGKASKGANYCGRCGVRLNSVTKAAGTAVPVVRKVGGDAAGVAKAAGRQYVHPTRRGPLFDEDPTVREMTWRGTFGPIIEKGR